LALTALRHRRAQSIVLLLAVVAIAACAAGPMYQRAVEPAAVRSQLVRSFTRRRPAETTSALT
jgi:Tfp pilus assembly major pilin PilA